MELTKEECLSALKSLYNNVPKMDDSEYEWGREVLLQCINERYDDTLYSYYASVFEDKDLTTLFEKYAFANDSNLSKDAIELKNELNDILHRFNKERNRIIYRHYQEMRERVVAQSDVIKELNDQLSRYYDFGQWEMEMVEKRCNPTLKIEDLEVSKHYYFIYENKVFHGLLMRKQVDKFYDEDYLVTMLCIDENGFQLTPTFKFENCMFYEKEVKINEQK